MSAKQVRWALAGIFMVGLVARVLAAYRGPSLYPDAYFQYLEPAWFRLTGAGVKTWEWNEGLRSWALPGFHGAWIALGMALGLAGATLGMAIRIFWGLASLLMVWAAWRAGASCMRLLRPRVACPTCAARHFAAPVPTTFEGDVPPVGWQGGLVSAALVACFPLLALYSVESLTELPSMIAMLAALALTAELCEMKSRHTHGRAALIGLLFSIGVCLRVVNAIVVPLPMLCLLLRRRWRDLGVMAGVATVPVLVFGMIDLLTWGDFLHSTIAHLRFNLIEGRAAEFGKAPPEWYVITLYSRLRWGLPLLLLPALWGLRATWPYVVSAIITLACITTQAHKEERFAILIWPLLFIAAGSVAGRWIFPARNQGPPPALWRRMLVRSRQIVCAVGFFAIMAASGARLDGIDHTLPLSRMRAQAWIGRQREARGLLVDMQYSTGGYLWLGRTLPQVEYQQALLANPIFSHVLVEKGSNQVSEARAAGFSVWHEDGNMVVLGR